MKRLIRWRRGLAVGVIALAAFAAACSKGDSAGVAPKVELSEGKVVVRDPRALTASVRYRFTQGKPRAGRQYKLQVTVLAEKNNRSFNLFSGDGADLPPDGVLEKEFTVPPPGTPWKAGETVSYDFLLYMEGGIKGRFDGISNRVGGKTEVPQ